MGDPPNASKGASAANFRKGAMVSVSGDSGMKLEYCRIKCFSVGERMFLDYIDMRERENDATHKYRPVTVSTPQGWMTELRKVSDE